VNTRYFALGAVGSFVNGWDWKYWGCDTRQLWGDEKCVTHTTTALQEASSVAHLRCSFGFSFKAGRALYKNIAVSHYISLVINRELLSAPTGISVGFHENVIFSERQHLNFENIWGH